MTTLSTAQRAEIDLEAAAFARMIRTRAFRKLTGANPAAVPVLSRPAAPRYIVLGL